MTGVGFRTPFIVFFGVLLLPALSFKNWQSALDGFISEPLFWSSGFASLELALAMLLLRFRAPTLTRTAENFGQILSFCYGVFITTVLSLALKRVDLIELAIFICILLTLLMLIVDFAYAKRVAFIDNLFSSRANEAARQIGQKVLCFFILIFFVSYVVFIYIH